MAHTNTKNSYFGIEFPNSRLSLGIPNPETREFNISMRNYA